MTRKKYGEILGMTKKSLPGGLLSGQIYKICTLLSTDIVEKEWRFNQAIGPSALLHAGCTRGVPYVWHGGR